VRSGMTEDEVIRAWDGTFIGARVKLRLALEDLRESIVVACICELKAIRCWFKRSER
jgi:hypothetical protein